MPFGKTSAQSWHLATRPSKTEGCKPGGGWASSDKRGSRTCMASSRKLTLFTETDPRTDESAKCPFPFHGSKGDATGPLMTEDGGELPTELPPSPPPLPLFGNLFDVGLAGTPWDLMLQLEPKYGPVTRLQLPIAGDFYLVHDPAAVEELTTVQTTAFPDRLSTPVFDNLNLNKGLVYETGDTQRFQKKLCRPSFSNSACLDTFLTAIKEETSTMATRWNAAGSGQRLDLYEEARRLTLDIVLRVTFGARIDRSDELSNVIGEFITQTVNVANEVPPWWAAGISISYRRVQVLLPKIREIIIEIVAKRRDELAGGARTQDGDLLGELLMQSEGSDMSDDAILYVLFDCIIAGSDTTASTIAAMLFRLYQEPEVMQNVRAELAAAGPLDDIEMYELEEKLPYLEACVKETLRLYPPVPMIGRKAVMAGEIAGYLVPDKSTLAWSPWFLGRDGKQWQEPVTAFEPKRWDDAHPDWFSAPGGKERHQFSFLPFGAGPRGCLGRQLGIMEATVGSAYLLNLFDFEFEKVQKDLTFKYDLTLNLKGSCVARVNAATQPC